MLLAVLATPAEAVAEPAGFTARVMDGVWDNWHRRRRQRVYKAAACLALAAAVLVAVFAIRAPKGEPGVNFAAKLPGEVVRTPEVAPPPREKAPAPKPLRFNDEFAKAGQALRAAPQPLADSVAVAPKLFDALFAPPAAPVAPMGEALEPARQVARGPTGRRPHRPRTGHRHRPEGLRPPAPRLRAAEAEGVRRTSPPNPLP